MQGVSHRFYILLVLLTKFRYGGLIPTREKCPEVRKMDLFNIFEVLGHWYVLQYYSSSEEALTYRCMQVDFELSRGYMDMHMHLQYKYVNDPNHELQKGNITWQIPDPRRPEHWRHSESYYTGIYNTDVIDTDYKTWMLLLHCADPQKPGSKRFLSSFVLSRTPKLDELELAYLGDKLKKYQVPMEYLFLVDQITQCDNNFDETTEDEIGVTAMDPFDYEQNADL